MTDDSQGHQVEAGDCASEAEVVGKSKKPKLTKEERIERERDSLIAAMANGTTNRLSDRVASILSRYPEARDNDVTLQLGYWRNFEPELFGSLQGNIESLHELTPSGSLIRARQKIQNSFGMFVASVSVRAMRGVLSQEEREKHRDALVPGPSISVFADETGKTDGDYLVGSVWVINTLDVGRVYNRVEKWRSETGYQSELHFVEIRDQNLAFCRQFVEVVIDAAPTISFKSVAIARHGISHSSKAYDRLFYELIVRGIAHENLTGRAPLSRSLFLVKDAENPGSDSLLLLNLRERIDLASQLQFENKLSVNQLAASASHTSPLVQMADLYAGALNRTQVRSNTSKPKAKDAFADFLLNRIDALTHMVSSDTVQSEDGDIHLRLRL